MPSEIKLVTMAEFEKMKPKQQGFVLYMQQAWPGSELRDIRNPYKKGTPENDEFLAGELRGVLAAQDSEE